MPQAITRPMLRQGSKGQSVIELQNDLNLAGAQPPLAADGDFGPKTLKAVRDFQAGESLVVDGIVGPLTWTALDAALLNPIRGNGATGCLADTSDGSDAGTSRQQVAPTSPVRSFGFFRGKQAAQPAQAIPPAQQPTTVFYGPGASAAPVGWQNAVTAAVTPGAMAALLQQAAAIPSNSGVVASNVTVNDVTAQAASSPAINTSLLSGYSFANPIVNYDENLEAKAGRNLAGRTRSTGSIATGFSHFVILGPKALKPDNFLWGRIVLNHELDHIRHVRSGSILQGDNSEVEAWTTTFTREFHRAYVLGDLGNGTSFVQQIQPFEPLLDYFERPGVSPAVRAAAQAAIEAYVRTTIQGHSWHLAAFRYWVHRSLNTPKTLLASNLNAALGLGIVAANPLSATRQFPSTQAPRTGSNAPADPGPSVIRLP
ncbi:MAG: peptidoglycan-binding protein [bacterium]